MKKLLLLLGMILSIIATSPTTTQAGFYTRHTHSIETIPSSAASPENAAPATAPVMAQAKQVKARHSFVGRLLSRAKDAAIPEVLYIILAIFGFGWLAMGINDSFGDLDWLISLLLYFIFYLPGLIYTLIKLPKYY